MVVFLSIKEMSYSVVGLFDNLVDPLSFLSLLYKFFSYVVCFNSALA